MQERLQKILARAGYGSRRACEEIIERGRVRVNGQPAGLGSKADAHQDKISVDGRQIASEEQLVYVMLYKPRGVLSAVSSDDDRQTVRDLVPLPGTLYPVGRLDFDSEGLLLMTNDGELANRLTHPRYEHEKEYRVLVAAHPDKKQLELWRRGVVLADGFKTQPAEVIQSAKFGKGSWLRVVLKEGHKRQIREMGRVTGLPVVKIIRVRMGQLRLGNLKPRQWRHLTVEELAALRSGL
jgi:23S rRNA pseudouridine2605 synthase